MIARLQGQLFVFSLVTLLAITASAVAIPNAALNPHPNGAGKISWQPVAGDPETHNHFHFPLPGGANPTQEEQPLHIRDATNKWAAFSVWDNRDYRFTPPNNTQATNTLWDKFAHGYINPAQAPRYCFEAGWSNEAKMRVAEGFTAWDTAAKAKSAGKTTPDGTGLITSAAFTSSTNTEGCEFDFQFKDNFLGNFNVFAVWAFTEPVAVQYNLSAKTMAFTTTPFARINVPGGQWHLRAGNAGNFGQVYTNDVGWSFDKTPELIVDQDIDYQCVNATGCGGIPSGAIREGNEADFVALNLQLTTNAFRSFPATDTVRFHEFDFWTTLLHEQGHILGLGHEPTNATTSIMREDIAEQASFGGPYPLQTIDDGSAIGAAALYTISVPEPAIAPLLFVAAGLSRAGRRR